MICILTSAVPLYELLSMTRLADIIVALVCNPTSSRLTLISPYWSRVGDEPTVILPSWPKFVFFSALLDPMNESSIVLSTSPKSSKLNVN